MSPARLAAALVVAAFAAPVAAAADRPNIVYLLADDLGNADVGWRGGDAKTPRLDKLAEGGAKLDQFYVLPLCSPTRAALLTGRYPIRYGLQLSVVRPWASYGLPVDERTLPQALKEAGYQTAVCGKWHLGHNDPKYLPTRRGFDRQYGCFNGAIDYFTHKRGDGLDWHRDDKALEEDGYATDLIGREAARLVRGRDKAKPLFLYVPFTAPHDPHQVPDDYKKPYARFPEPRRSYLGMVAAMDDAVGRVVDALDAEGIRGDTLILFCSDNGGNAPGKVSDNGKLRAGKGTLYEGGVRVPAIANWPGKVRPGTVVDQPVHVTDWYPTLLKLGGAKLDQPLPLDGHDVWPVISDGRKSPRQEVLLNTTPAAGAIRVGDWKLVLNGARAQKEAGGAEQAPAKAAALPPEKMGPESTELFDLAADPGEQTNLAAKHPDKVAELKAKLAGYAKAAAPPRYEGAPAPGFKPPKVWGQPD